MLGHARGPVSQRAGCNLQVGHVGSDQVLPQVMPPLRSCLEMATDKSQKMLRAKALECISLVGMAVGKDLFREDAHAVMRFMQVMQVLNA